MVIDVKVKRLSPNAVSLKYQRQGDAGFDLALSEALHLSPGETKAFPIGWAFAIPQGYEIQIRARSGLSLNTKLRLSNSLGTLDSNFRGQVCVIFDNIGTTPICLPQGSRIAQGVLKQSPVANFIEVDELDKTVRGEQGFGSSGT